jgi:flagellar biosynthesis/type III secretory pathway protein FliH
MKKRDLMKVALSAIFGLGLLISATDASAQGNSRWAHEKNRIKKQQKAYEKQQRQAQRNYYRVYRNGSYYQTDQRGADLLRQAVQQGYRQGYQTGLNDRRYSRNSGYYGSNIYRNGTYGYQSYVDRNQYQYYFQQGFQRGYTDGYNSRTQYGYRSGNSVNILGAILNGILNISRY